MVFGKRKRGRPKTRYNIKELTSLSMVQVYRMAQDRREWKHLLWMLRLINPIIYPYNDDDDDDDDDDAS